MPWQLKPGPNKGRFETTSCRAARSKKLIHFSKKMAKLDYLPPLRVEGVVNPISVEIGLAQFVWMKNWIIYPLYSWQALLIQFFIHTSWANPISVEIGLSHPSTRKGGR